MIDRPYIVKVGDQPVIHVRSMTDVIRMSQSAKAPVRVWFDRRTYLLGVAPNLCYDLGVRL
jgi:hypothetical protein